MSDRLPRPTSWCLWRHSWLTLSRPGVQMGLDALNSSDGVATADEHEPELACNHCAGSSYLKATFLAGVQAQAISFSLDQQNTNLQIGCNALFFGGLFLDVLSGTIAIVGAIQLQRTYTLLQQRESALTSLSEVLKDTAQFSKEFQRDNLALAHHLRFLKMIVFRLLQSPRLWNELSVQLKESADLAEDILRESNLDDADRITVAYSLADYRYTTNRLAKTAFRTSLGFAASLTAPWLVLAGLCSFTAGVVCLVLYSQPVEVSATSFSVLGGTGLVLFTVLAVIIGVDPRPVTLPFPDGRKTNAQDQRRDERGRDRDKAAQENTTTEKSFALYGEGAETRGKTRGNILGAGVNGSMRFVRHTSETVKKEEKLPATEGGPASEKVGKSLTKIAADDHRGFLWDSWQQPERKKRVRWLSGQNET
ncbi:hypothetical protein B0H13DRAFT_2547701 [Mycena leptocephala]|nr:hypothetical protein B0H13DRAFT_2547701 [Mycena leptocephala]